MAQFRVTVVNEITGEIVGRYATVQEAEAKIAELEREQPEAVHAGEYGIDVPEEWQHHVIAQRPMPGQPGAHVKVEGRELMAQFRGTLQGSRGAASRLGTKASGLKVTCNGWDVGVEAEAHTGERVGGRDAIDVYATGGSNGVGGRRLIARVLDTPEGPHVVDSEGLTLIHPSRFRLSQGEGTH